ncbi:MAG TPA: alanine--tRNA ligase-related protein, partial [Gemmatales bacterium]|nr:alanine--tRNA ligase-related protein [Gemmatales bacterium]
MFSPLLAAIGDLLKAQYTGKLDDPKDVAFRVLADHLRMLTFSLTDHAEFSNKGRGSVVRSVLRRAVRFGYQTFSQREPFLYKLVPAVVHQMGEAFPELTRQPGKVAEMIRGEEIDFLKTIDRGLSLFEEASSRATGNVLRGQDVFDLYTTYGFPPDLTRQMAQERGLTTDETGFQAAMLEHEEKSKGKAVSAQVALNVSTALPTTDDRPKWSGSTGQATLLGWIADNEFVTKGSLQNGGHQSVLHSDVALILDRTCFYAESGGQVGDTGMIST